METNHEKLMELQKQKKEIEQLLKNIDTNLALLNDYTKQLREYKDLTI